MLRASSSLLLRGGAFAATLATRQASTPSAGGSGQDSGAGSAQPSSTASSSTSGSAAGFQEAMGGMGDGRKADLHADGTANIGDEPDSWKKGTGAPGSMRYGSGGMYGGGTKNPLTAAMKGEVNDTQSAREKAVDMVHKRKEITQKVKANITGNYNPHDHFLLVDLDVEKDAVLFGQDREMFYQNVEKMKRVVVEYQRWERRDNFYIWGTRALQFFTFAVLFDTWDQYTTAQTLARNYDDYKRIHEEELTELRSARTAAFARAEETVRAMPPDFRPILKAAREREKQQAAGVNPDKSTAASHPMDTLEEAKRLREERDKLFGSAAAHSASPLSVPMIRAVRRTILPQSDDWVAVVREEIAEHQKEKLERQRLLEENEGQEQEIALSKA